MASVNYAVTDFICIEIAGNRIFGVFNVADGELSAGVVLVVIHLLFLDKNALFKGKKEDSEAENGSRKDKNENDSEYFPEKGMKENSAGQNNDSTVADKTAAEAENDSDGTNND